MARNDSEMAAGKRLADPGKTYPEFSAAIPNHIWSLPFHTRNHNIQNPLILLIASRAISLGFFHTPLNVRSVAGVRHSVPTDLVARDGREFCQVE